MSKSGQRIKLAIRLVFAALLIAYPFLVYAGLATLDIRVLAAFFTLIIIGRVGILWLLGEEFSFKGQAAFASIALLVAAAAFVFQSEAALLYYPVIVNGFLFIVFAGSLFYPPPVAERIARTSEPDLPPAAQRYTRKVTHAWCAFFLLNGGISLATILWGNLGYWTLYNGVLSYVFIGVFFAAEYLIRQILRRRLSVSKR